MKLFADMHVHSKFSIDGTSTMEEYCLTAEKTGSRIICFTEHVDFNSMEKNLSIIKDNRTQNFVEDEFFPGEIKEMILEAVAEKLKNTAAKTRRYDVLADIIQRNGFEGASEKRANTIKILLRDYRTMSGTLRQALMDLGFTITEDGKHYRLTYYGDGRYKTTVSKTASDHREGKNIASTIIKNMF